MSAFEELGICPEIIQAVQENEWLLPTPVQAESIPLILGGGDVCVAAETGSGKTGAFGLPCLQIVHEHLRNKATTTTNSYRGVLDVKLNAGDKHTFVSVTEDREGCKSNNDKQWEGIRGSCSVLSGKYIYEVEVLEGLVRVGWSTPMAILVLGKDDQGFGFGGTGKKSWNNKFEDYGEAFTPGDVLGCRVDRYQQTISFSKNGRDLGLAYRIPLQLHKTPLMPHICGKKFEVRCNFDNLKFPVASFAPLGQIKATDTPQALDTTDMAGRISRQPVCMILEPTRELAQQTYECMTEFGVYLEAPKPRSALFVGGIDEKGQLMALQQGVDICVGTLSKTMAHIKSKKLDPSKLRFLVLDEADDLMRNDDRKDIPKIKEMAIRGGGGRKVQTLFFSATLHSSEVRMAIEKITVSPTWVDLKGKPTIPETVHFVCYKVDPTTCSKPRFGALDKLPPTDGIHDRDQNNAGEPGHSKRTKILKPQVAVKIADVLKMENCLVFCRTNVDCNNFEKYLTELGGGRGFTGQAETGKENPYSCVVLAGMRSQEERQANLDHFRSGNVRFLVCTDVAARGIDIKELPYLIMMTLPDDPDQFFHRVGRVGRADRLGLAISIVSTQREKVWYHKCKDRGRNCSNTRLVEEGGCCIWYDEPSYLKAIESRIGDAIPVMDPVNFSVPGILNPQDASTSPQGTEEGRGRRSLARPQQVVAGAAGHLVLYGKMKDDHQTKETQRHLEDIHPLVTDLKTLEKKAQEIFVSGAFLRKPLF